MLLVDELDFRKYLKCISEILLIEYLLKFSESQCLDFLIHVLELYDFGLKQYMDSYQNFSEGS